ncbi:terminase small subunit protein [Elizabethkingia anophelis]|nr:terminase small subunit protein [Elizabethkingia anophelis]
MSYSQEDITSMFETIICEIADKGRSVRSILKDEGMPSMRTFFKWLDEDEEKVKQYARACEIRAEGIFDEILDIADDGTNDYMTLVKGDMEYNVEDREVTNRSKLRVDARKFWLSKVHPKKYGDKIDVTSKGDKIEGGQPTIINLQYAPPPDEEEEE